MDAVTRQSRSGAVIGPEERISPQRALEAMTIDAAWIYREEDSKGSISRGKLADFVVLDANPLAFPPDGLRELQVLATIKEGRLRALAVTGLKRIKSLPEVPTLDEAAMPKFEVTTWQGIFAPAGTPRPVLVRVHAEFVKAVHSPELRPKIEQQDMEPTGPALDAFAASYREQVVRWTKVARDAGL